MNEPERAAHIRTARLARTHRLIAALDVLIEERTGNLDWDMALHASRRMNDEQWDGLGLRAGLRTPPSIDTRSMVISGLQERIRIRAKMRSLPGMISKIGESS